jgi:hypothetical protein
MSADKKNNPALITPEGNLDIAKLLEANPNALASFINPNQEGEGGGAGGATGTQAVAMPVAMAIAAARAALDLSPGYVPQAAQQEALEMAAQAQVNLGLEPAQGLEAGPSPMSNMNSPFGTSSSSNSLANKIKKQNPQTPPQK